MIDELILKIDQANKAYRVGSPIMSDKDYDILVDQLAHLDPHNDLLKEIGFKVDDSSRKRKIPITMASMNKVKSISEIDSWVKNKNIDPNEDVVITPKYDGLSLCVNEKTGESFTRGDGVHGQKSDDHYKSMSNKYNGIPVFDFTYGEVMLPKSVFLEKYSNDFENPRNLVAGLLNSKEISPFLSDCVYIKYGGVFSSSDIFTHKNQILSVLNDGQSTKVPFKITKLSDITEDFMQDLFDSWSRDFEIDGLILEIDELKLHSSIGRETSTNNPGWARAYKSPNFEQTADSEVIGISWNISKQGLLKPIVHINPVRLDGVTVSNVTGNNARFIKDMGIGVGSVVKVKRSGMVIPIIYDVIVKKDFEMPTIPDIEWNSNGIELITKNETDEQVFKQLVSFFDTIGTDFVSEGVIKQLWDAGYKDVSSILTLTIEDYEKIDRFGKRKSKIVHDSIKKAINSVSLSKLQHATGIFRGLGSKKLILLEHFDKKPTLDQVMEIEGFAEISAKSYIDNYDRFFEMIKNLPIEIKKSNKPKVSTTSLDKFNFVFTGVRRKDLEDMILSNGGKVGSSVSKSTTHLVMKEVGSGSSKEKKAQELGVEIITVDQLENILKIYK